MKVGLIPPQGYFDEFDGWPADKAFARVVEISKLAERLGFDSLWFGEHNLAKWNRHEPIFDCFTMATAIAAVVPNVTIGFCVINSTFRNPGLTAKMAATLDAASGGRLILGLGAGFKEVEAEAWGVPYPEMKERLAMLREHFEIISRLTTAGEEPFSFEGRFAKVHMIAHRGAVRRPAAAHPAADRRPRRAGHVPHRRRSTATRSTSTSAVADWNDGIAALHERCEEIGRDPNPLAVASGTHPAFPYKGLRVTGNQRMMTSEDLPSIIAFDLDSTGDPGR